VVRGVGRGTDLTLGVGGRRWWVADGRENMPDGEVYVAPHAGSLEGEITFARAAVHAGRAIEGVRLRFARGQVVEASARRGQAFLDAALQTDAGARRAGEFAFGLNDGIERFTGEALFDEKIDGTVHLALGASLPECHGDNESALHWDLVCDLRAGGEAHADGRLVYRDGRFLDG
jgi:aminopeptidase